MDTEAQPEDNSLFPSMHLLCRRVVFPSSRLVISSGCWWVRFTVNPLNLQTVSRVCTHGEANDLVVPGGLGFLHWLHEGPGVLVALRHNDHSGKI